MERSPKYPAARRSADFRAQLAPFFAAAEHRRGADDAADLWGVVVSTWLLPWVVAVVGVNLGAMQLARTQSITVRRSLGPPGPPTCLPGWRNRDPRVYVSSASPFIFSQPLDPGTQVIAASVMAGSASPALASSSFRMRHGVDDCVHLRCRRLAPSLRGTASLSAHALDPVYAWRLDYGVLTVARWAFHQLKMNADVGSQSESASLLLQEYEQRGVGWLWSIDDENRGTYISSRMSALLGARQVS